MEFVWEFLKIAVALLVIVFFYFKWSFNYWAKRNVPTLPVRIPFGNITNPLTRTKSPVFVMIANMYNEFKKIGAKHGGIYIMARPLYITIDPEYVKNILSNDFIHFTDRGAFYNEKDDPLSAHLFSIGGDKWKHLRAKLTPTFTSGKMKMMFQTLVDCGIQMMEFLEKVEHNGEAMDVKEVCACYTTDVIGSCAFGLECNCFKDPNAEFRYYDFHPYPYFYSYY